MTSSSAAEIDINISKAIPKPKGDANYQQWLKSLEIALRSKELISNA